MGRSRGGGRRAGRADEEEGPCLGPVAPPSLLGIPAPAAADRADRRAAGRRETGAGTAVATRAMSLGGADEFNAALEKGSTYTALQLFHSRFRRFHGAADAAEAGEFAIACATRLAESGDDTSASEVLLTALEAAASGEGVGLSLGKTVELARQFPAADRGIAVLRRAALLASRGAEPGAASSANRALAEVLERSGALGDAMATLRRDEDGAQAQASVALRLAAAGYPSELDLFVCREALETVLQASIARARAFLDAVEGGGGVGAWMDSPLRNMVQLLFAVAECDSGMPLKSKSVSSAMSVYTPALMRDEALSRLITKVSIKVGITRPEKRQQDGLGGILGSLLRDG